jgi:sugar O-acyltransferase (sialic acid O-acetyltransferase NeuD family)
MKQNKIILIGGGGHCKSCIDVIEQENKYEIEGIIDVKEKVGEKILKYPVIGSDDDIEEFSRSGYSFFITLGQIYSVEKRKLLFNRLIILNLKLPVIVSPRAYVSKYSQIGEGTIVMHNALINANTSIGMNCIINTSALIEHDSAIGNHCHVSTKAIVNGEVQVGDCSFIGSGAVIKNNIALPANSFVKANSLAK